MELAREVPDHSSVVRSHTTPSPHITQVISKGYGGNGASGQHYVDTGSPNSRRNLSTPGRVRIQIVGGIEFKLSGEITAWWLTHLLQHSPLKLSSATHGRQLVRPDTARLDLTKYDSIYAPAGRLLAHIEPIESPPAGGDAVQYTDVLKSVDTLTCEQQQALDAILAGDNVFLTALNLIREGDTKGLDFINAHALTEPDAQAITVCTTNRSADTRNAAALSRIKERASDFKADIAGTFRESDAPATLTLSVKPGAPVMVVANTDLVCTNGECGEVVSVSKNAQVIQVRLDTGREVGIERRVWHVVSYTLVQAQGGIRLEQRITGSFVQFGLAAAAVRKPTVRTWRCA